MLYLPSKYCEGLEADKDNRRIDQKKVDTGFQTTCDEFNSFLDQKVRTGKMEVVV